MRIPFIVFTGCAFAAQLAQAQSISTLQLPPPQTFSPPISTLAPISSDEPEISLEDLLRLARENNPRLQVARETVTSALEQAKATRSLPNPTLQLVPGFSGSSNARDEEVIVAQPLDLFGLRRARSQVLSASARGLQAQQRLVERSLVIDVRNAVALLFAAQEAEKLEKVQVEVARLFRNAASKRADLGDVPTIQVERAQLELARAENALSAARSQRLTRRTVVNQLIGAPPQSPLRVALPLGADVTELLTVPALLPVLPTTGASNGASNEPNAPSPATSATSGGSLVAPDAGSSTADSTLRPDLLSARANLEAQQAQVKAIGRQLLPIVELQARRSAFFGRDGSYALRAVVTVPLFDFGSIKGQRRAAQAAVRSQEANLKLLQQQVDAQIERARIQLQNRQQSVSSYQKEIVPLSLDLLRKTQVGYAQGASTYLEVLEAQRALRQVQSEYLQALIGVQTGENALDAAQNGGVPLFNNGLLNSGLNSLALGVTNDDSQ